MIRKIHIRIPKRYFRLQPFDDIHFNQTYATFGDHSASKPVLYGLLAVGIFLLIAGLLSISSILQQHNPSIVQKKSVFVKHWAVPTDN